MRVLFVSNDLIGGGIAHRLTQEGCDVKLYIDFLHSKDCLDNIVPKTGDWHRELDWVGKDGLIVFDDVGFGKVQDKLRADGYTVFGGCDIGDRMEEDRYFAHQVFQQYGLKTADLVDFDNIEDAIEYVQKHPKAWVIKQNGNLSKSMNYVGHFNDGRDVVSLLKNYHHNNLFNRTKITLQERVHGVEIAVGRYFNGHEWIGPIEINVEHKRLFPGDIGPMTSEMGTLVWYEKNETNRIFDETLARLKPFLQKHNYRGVIDLNCIANLTGIYPLEATSRMGSPMVNLQSEMHLSPWSELLPAIARGESYNLKCKRGYGVVVVIATSPFPYPKENLDSEHHSMYGIDIFFDNISAADHEHIFFEEVSLRPDDGKGANYYISGRQGYVLYVTGQGPTIEAAREKVETIIKKIIIPKMTYRNDIGVKFDDVDQQTLTEWGYL